MIKKASNISYKWVEAPRPTQLMPHAPAVLGVNLEPGEEVEWLWTHTDKGSYVSGYNIVRNKSEV